MRKAMRMLLLVIIANALFTSCQSPEQKVGSAQDKVDDAKKDLKTVQNEAEAKRISDAEEWKIYKAESAMKIKDNESAIILLKEKMNVAGKKMNAEYLKSVNALEEKNRALQARMDVYDKGQSDWATYKREFSHDMDELGKALKDLTVDNKK
jgi:outer membrane PBP1 activator LpoA protein